MQNGTHFSIGVKLTICPWIPVPPHGYELNNLDNDALDAPNIYQEDMSRQRYPEPAFPVDSDEPVSMPAELSSDERFKHSNPAYQSAVLHTTSSDGDGSKEDRELISRNLYFFLSCQIQIISEIFIHSSQNSCIHSLRSLFKLLTSTSYSTYLTWTTHFIS